MRRFAQIVENVQNLYEKCRELVRGGKRLQTCCESAPLTFCPSLQEPEDMDATIVLTGLFWFVVTTASENIMSRVHCQK